MDTRISRIVAAPPESMYRLAAAVEDWPRLLPHYRWVRVLATNGPRQRTVDMAAWRGVIPLHWTAIQTLYPDDTIIRFEHIRGISRGMRVTWTIAARHVEIRHVFNPRWPLPDQLIAAVVGEYFVNGVARRTLANLSALAESIQY